jgi:UDP-N-acetylglucosamine--N-acetylmuramyl-(pentapeptide) pyrophosphoryl-undecaprenol N-acetylglucosamine transferase
MNIAIAGGGTGGHIFPALAIARELENEIAGARVTFIGTARGLEAKIIPKEGFDVRFIRSEGLVGRDMLTTIRSALTVPVSIKDAFGILKAVRPDVVLGVGGYSSGPVLLCAKLMGLPTIIHEQNTMPGLANRILGKFVDNVAVTYQESIKFFPKERTFLTGNPVREEIFKGDRERGYKTFNLDREKITIFVFGGSRGASHINSAVGEALVYLESYKENIQFLHQTGDNDFNFVKEIYTEHGFKGTVMPFAFEMADAYAVSDLVISRAGATTLAELTALGKAAILVPYPHAAGDHQAVNARKLWDIGAAHMILDRDVNGKTLSDMIRFLLEDPEAIAEMERTSKSLGSRGAAGKVINLVKGLIKKKLESRTRSAENSYQTI